MRTGIAVALIVVGSLLAATANVAVWAERTALDTDTYVETVTPIPADEGLTQAVSVLLAEEVLERVDLEELAADVLPGSVLDTLGGPVEDLARAALVEVIEGVLQSAQFEAIWVRVNEEVHGFLVDALTDRSEYVRIVGDEVLLDLDPVLQTVDDELDERFGVRVFADGVPDGTVEIALFQSAELGDAKRAIELLQTLAFVLPLLALVVLVAAVVVAPRRLWAVSWVGAGLAGASLLTLALEAVGQWSIIGSITDPISRLAGETLWDLASRSLVSRLLGLALLGVAIAVVGAVTARSLDRSRPDVPPGFRDQLTG